MVETVVFDVFNVQCQLLRKVAKSVYCLTELYICVVFHENISKGFHLTKQTQKGQMEIQIVDSLLGKRMALYLPTYTCSWLVAIYLEKFISMFRQIYEWKVL